jgi:glycerol-3-phosphate O-acyltransferase/dihydroxyacetone phosphate acyltransferase
MAYRNLPLPLGQRLIYFFLRALAWIGPGVFYRRRLVLGREHLRFDGPAVVIANHPSTLTDVLNAGLPVHQEMFFLANYGLFRHPVTNWLFRRLFAIPVKRREDVEEGEARNNDAAFEQSYRHLEKGGVLFIAPEGVSYMNRIVRPFKTGTARIAAGAAARNDWKLDVQIVPIGLTYDAPHLFRSNVVVVAGEPVHVRDWSEAWAADPVQAADDLTAHLEARLRSLTVHTRDEAGDLFVARLETVLANNRPLPPPAAFRRSQRVAEGFIADDELETTTTAYFEALRAADLTDAGLSALRQPALRAWAEAYFLVLGFPLAAAGLAFWLLPCFIPWLLNRQLKLYIGYSSTVKILAGLFTFPLALWGAYRLGAGYFGEAWVGLLSVSAAVGLGYFAERYLDVWKHFWERWKAVRLVRRAPEAVQKLVVLQQAILERLENPRSEDPVPVPLEADSAAKPA